MVKVSWSNITQEYIFCPSKTNYNSNENSGYTNYNKIQQRWKCWPGGTLNLQNSSFSKS